MATEDGGKPLLNPVLALTTEPRKEAPDVRSKDASKIVGVRLPNQMARLAASCRSIYAKRRNVPVYGGRILIRASMFDDSYAPTYTPSDLFTERLGCRLVAPTKGGYLIEALADKLQELAAAIERPLGPKAQVDISRIEDIRPFDGEAVLRGRTVDDLWKSAPAGDHGKLFMLWLAPFVDAQARESLMTKLEELARSGVFIPTLPGVDLERLPGIVESRLHALQTPNQSSLARAVRRYRNSGHARASVWVQSKDALSQLVSSGASFRVDAVQRLEVMSAGEGREPGPPPPHSLTNQPIVGVVDGGLTANSYLVAEAWRAPAFVEDGKADHTHGNRVTSLVVQAHAWNNNLHLPELFCRVGTVQAVPRRGANVLINPEALIAYLERVVAAHPNTKVWNFSVNEPDPVDSDTVSFLGHEISRLAREHGILPVICVGNKSSDNKERLCPPADCEAAIVVAGRQNDSKGRPADRCPISLPGPGPEGMRKPDVSWFSNLRVLGGTEQRGTSFAAPLVSALAAHTFANLREPTPDMVRGLLLNAAEIEEFCFHLGWGTPYHGHLPWNCAPGSVTLAWRSELRPGVEHYWDGIPIPPQMVRGGKMFGSASLTAILRPLLSEEGEGNYFASRLETALQYRHNGATKNLLGSMKESEAPELIAREDYAKWQPIRRHSRKIKKGVGFTEGAMRLRARVYTRDLFQFGIGKNRDLEPQEVTFVLTLSDGSNSADIYNSVAQQLGSFVESAVINQEIEIER